MIPLACLAPRVGDYGLGTILCIRLYAKGLWRLDFLARPCYPAAVCTASPWPQWCGATYEFPFLPPECRWASSPRAPAVPRLARLAAGRAGVPPRADATVVVGDGLPPRRLPYRHARLPDPPAL